MSVRWSAAGRKSTAFLMSRAVPGFRVGGHEERGPVDRRPGGARRGDRTVSRSRGVRFNGIGLRHLDWRNRSRRLRRFYLTRDGVGFCVRPHRYALPIAVGSVAARVLGLRQCDNRVCLKIADATQRNSMSCPAPRAATGADGADGSRGWSPCGATLRQTGVASRTVGGAA